MSKNKEYTIEIEIVSLPHDDERVINFNEAMNLLLPNEEIMKLIFRHNKKKIEEYWKKNYIKYLNINENEKKNNSRN